MYFILYFISCPIFTLTTYVYVRQIQFVLLYRLPFFLPHELNSFILMSFFSFLHFLQDLQSEIETHRVVYDRLDGTGRKLLCSLTSQEDAVMLQRRLDEMNHRWNHLKSKSIAIRYVTHFMTHLKQTNI